MNQLPDALQKPDWVVNPAWVDQPWQDFGGQSLVKDETQFVDHGIADPSGLLDHLGQWNVGDIVATVTDIGEVVSTPVTAIDVGIVTARAAGGRLRRRRRSGSGVATWPRTSTSAPRPASKRSVRPSASTGVAQTADGLTFASPPRTADWFGDGITMTARLVEFLTDIRLLRRIPLSYLVPDARLLPPESIRFFHVNQTWVDRVIDGVVSNTNLGTVDFHRSLTVLQTIRETDVNPAPDQMTGMLIRSELVRRWPKMIVRAYTGRTRRPTRNRMCRSCAPNRFRATSSSPCSPACPCACTSASRSTGCATASSSRNG